MRQPSKHKKIEQEKIEQEQSADIIDQKSQEEIIAEELKSGPIDGEIIDAPDVAISDVIQQASASEESKKLISDDEHVNIEDVKKDDDIHFVEQEQDTVETESEQVSSEVSDEEVEPEVLKEEIVDTEKEHTNPPKEDSDELNEKVEEGTDENKKKKKSTRPLYMRYPDKYQKKTSTVGKIVKKLLAILIFFILTFGVIGVVGLGIMATVIYSYSDSELDEKLAHLELDYTSIIYVNSIETGGYVQYEELYNSQNRVWVSLDEMPKALLDAVVAVEDKRFFSHQGVDPITTLRATVTYVLYKATGRSTNNLAGGSTLTQQLVKNITGDKQSSPLRKVTEMLRALYVERNYSKNQILEYYLNAVNFGNNQDGIYAAAKYYFDKEVKDLTPVECAAIVGITRSPAYIEPYKNPESNKTRRNHILYEMYSQGMISEEEYQEYINTDIVLRDRNAGSGQTSLVMSWFSDMVFDDVKNSLMEMYGFSSAQASSYIYTAGLRIYTTMVKEYQDICENYFYDESNYLKVEETEEQPEVAFELINPENGNILAVIGGRGAKNQSRLLNRATQTVRQPGSAIKPITVYGYAIENNLITSASTVDDTPMMMNDKDNTFLEHTQKLLATNNNPNEEIEYTPWPTNYSNVYNGFLDIKSALSNSYNTPSAKVLNLVGVDTSYNFAKTMLGLKSLVPADKNLAPLSVGALTYGVTLQELTCAYTVYANNGIYSSPRCVTRVETYDGKILYENEVDKQVVFTPQTAYIMTNILDATKGSASISELKGIATAGKSGTTNSFKDRWFIGYTPNLLAGIWWGYDYPNKNENVHHIQMWHDVMTLLEEASGATVDAEFKVPDGIVNANYCNVSGGIPTDACLNDPRGTRSRVGSYKAGTTPTEECKMHHYLYVCRESGQIATEHCTDVMQVVFIDTDRSFPYAFIETRDAEYVCPRLYADTILYTGNDLPAYMYMLPEGEYPALSTNGRKNMRNYACRVHSVQGEINHYYTFSLLDNAEQEKIHLREEGYVLPQIVIKYPKKEENKNT